MSQSSAEKNKILLSPSLNARRMRTDLKTSENVFLHSTASRSRSSSPSIPQKTAKASETLKATGNSAMRCDLFHSSLNRNLLYFDHCQNLFGSWHCEINLPASRRVIFLLLQLANFFRDYKIIQSTLLYYLLALFVCVWWKKANYRFSNNAERKLAKTVFRS